MNGKIHVLAILFLLPAMTLVAGVQRDNLTLAEALATIITEVQTEAIKAIALSNIKGDPRVDNMVTKYNELMTKSNYLGSRNALHNAMPDDALKTYATGSVTRSIKQLKSLLDLSSGSPKFHKKLIEALQKQIKKFIKVVDSDKKLKLKSLPSRDGLTESEYLALIIADIQSRAIEAIAIARVNQNENTTAMIGLYDALMSTDKYLGNRDVLNKAMVVLALEKYASGSVTQSINQLANILKLSGSPDRFQTKLLKDLHGQVNHFVQRLRLDKALRAHGLA